MRRSVLLAFAIIFTIAAIAVLGVLVMSLSGKVDMKGFFSSGFSNMTSGELIKEATFDASALEELHISVREHKVEIVLTDDDFVTVRQYDYSGAEPFTAVETAASLNIAVDMDFRLAVFNTVIPRLEVSVPRTYVGDVKAASTSGSIVCGEAIRWNAVMLESKSGSIRFENGVKCGAFYAGSTSGAIRVGEIISDSGVSLEATSGSVRADGRIDCERLKASASSGTVSLGDANAKMWMEITTRSGSIRTGNLSAGEYTMSAGSGSIRTESLTGRGTATTSSGSISCAALTVTGDTHLQSSSGSVKVTMGDVKDLKFETTTGSGGQRTNGYNFTYDRSGKHGSCIVGDGSTGTLSIKTSSGSIVIS